MVSLNKDEIVKDLKRTFPEAAKLLKNGSWSDLLLKRRFPNAILAASVLSEEGSPLKAEIGDENEEVGLTQIYE